MATDKRNDKKTRVNFSTSSLPPTPRLKKFLQSAQKRIAGIIKRLRHQQTDFSSQHPFENVATAVDAPAPQTSETNRKEDVTVIRASDLFDEGWYLSNHRDVHQAGVDAAWHYLEFGGFEGRDPGPNFSSKWYVYTYNDAKESGINPLLHYLKYGLEKGYKTKHDPVDPILVHTMGRSGSTTVAKSILAAYLAKAIKVPYYDAHFLNDLDAAEQIALNERPVPYDRLKQIEHYKEVRRVIDENPALHWNIITLVREPVARNVAALFHALASFVPDWQQRYAAGTLDIHELQEKLITGNRINDIPDLWFDTQIKQIPAFGIDVYKTPFPHELGYKIYPGTAQASLLLIRLENLNECAGRAIHEFLDLDNLMLQNTNMGSERDYASLYHAFKKLPLPVDYVEKTYQTRFARHFYSAQELDAFKARWTKKRIEP